MRHRRVILIGLIAGGVLASIAGQAQTPTPSPPPYIFDVPVDMQSLPASISGASILCTVHLSSPTAESNKIGSGVTPITLAGGSFAGRVRVEIQMTPGRHPSEAGFWQCNLSGTRDGRSINFNLASDPSHLLFQPDLRRGPDFALKMDVSGKL